MIPISPTNLLEEHTEAIERKLEEKLEEKLEQKLDLPNKNNPLPGGGGCHQLMMLGSVEFLEV